MLYTSITISAIILRITKLIIRPRWRCINGKRGSVSLDTRKRIIVVICRSVHYYSFDPKVGSLSMSVALTWLNSCQGSHSVYWVGLHWTAIFIRMLRFGPIGVQQAPVQYGPTCLNQWTTQKLSKILSIERLDNGDQWTATACRLSFRHIHRATEINHDRHQSGCLMYGRKSNRWRHEYQSKRLLLVFFVVVQMFKLQSSGIWCTKTSLSTACHILQNILNEWPDSDNVVWVAACLRTMMIGLLQVDVTILHSVM
jgi:hypothetical protein